MVYTSVGLTKPQRIWGGGRIMVRRRGNQILSQIGRGAWFKGSVDHAMNRLENMIPMVIDRAINSAIDIPTQKIMAKTNTLTGSGKRRRSKRKRRKETKRYQCGK